MRIFCQFTIFFILSIKATFAVNFFQNFTDAPKEMLNLYNRNVSGFIPFFKREWRLEEQIEDSIMDGDVIYLNADNKKIFAIFTASEEKSDIGAIILHSRGSNPNEERLIKPLRIDMTKHGYNTLSVQMPVLKKTAKYYDYVPIFVYAHPRIQAAINFYKQRNINKIIIIAHGCGAHMAMSYIDKYGDYNISAFIGLGMGATDTNQTVVKQYPIATMQTPVLDIVGQYDYPSVTKHAKTRVAHLALSNKNNQQIIITKAKHYYDNKNTFSLLTASIYHWLNKINL